MSSIGEKIYKLRSERGLTLEELAQKIGVGKSTVQKWETGSINRLIDIFLNKKRGRVSPAPNAKRLPGEGVLLRY